MTRLTTTSAIAPVAAEIIAGRPPAIAIVTAIVNEAYRPTFGIDPGDQRERDRLGDQRERDDQPGKQLDAQDVARGYLKATRGARTGEEVHE